MLRAGPRAVAGLKALLPVLSTTASADEIARLQSINELFNRRILFRDDIEVWGQADYWASPLEMLDKGEGDCEDFAIAKYFSLLVSGVTAPKLRLVYVRARLGGPEGPTQAHMVLAYYAQPGAEPLILDNINKTIQPASNRSDLVPVYSFNGSGLWLAKQQQGRGQSAGSSDRIGHWKDLQNRMKGAT